jgi:hypothetical protein
MSGSFVEFLSLLSLFSLSVVAMSRFTILAASLAFLVFASVNAGPCRPSLSFATKDFGRGRSQRY